MSLFRRRATEAPSVRVDASHRAALLQAGALQSAIFNSANFSSIATDARGVIQIFNVGAERMLGYTAAEVVNTVTPADISDPDELIARARALSVELDTVITPGFEALVFKASRGIEDIYELTYIRKDRSRLPAVVSVTALRDAHDAIIGYLATRLLPFPMLADDVGNWLEPLGVVSVLSELVVVGAAVTALRRSAPSSG